MSQQDFIVDDICVEQPKKIKSKRKGKRGELEVVEVFNQRFSKLLTANPGWGAFSRSVGSGNRWGQNVRLSESAQTIYSGDVTCPEHFRFVIESKNGYDDIDLCVCFTGHCKPLDKFLSQVSKDAERVKKLPLLIWKKTRMPRIAFFKGPPVSKGGWVDAAVHLLYQDWLAVPLDDLMKTKDEFWFDVA